MWLDGGYGDYWDETAYQRHMTTTSLNDDEPRMERDQVKTNAEGGANFITLCPYTPQNAKKKGKVIKNMVNFDTLFGPQRWTKYFEMEPPVKDDFLLYNSLAEAVGTDVLFRHQRDGMYVIEAANEDQSEKLQELVEANNEDLPIRKNETLNVCHGTIVVPNTIEIGSTEFTECGEKIKRNIKMQGYEIKNVTTYVRPARTNRMYPLRIAKITFEGRILPDTVVVAGQRLSVREYVPLPRQCIKCWKFGHSIKYCKSELYVCPICGAKGHQKDNCTQKAIKKCVNCQGNHPAFAKSCLEYKKEQLIVKTQFKEGLPYKAALNKLKQTGEISAYNYKKALESKLPLTASTPKLPKSTTENRYNILQIEDSKGYTVAERSYHKSPKRKTKRIGDSSSEEGGVSPNQNPKQKPKTKSLKLKARIKKP